MIVTGKDVLNAEPDKACDGLPVGCAALAENGGGMRGVQYTFLRFTIEADADQMLVAWLYDLMLSDLMLCDLIEHDLIECRSDPQLGDILGEDVEEFRVEHMTRRNSIVRERNPGGRAWFSKNLFQDVMLFDLGVNPVDGTV